jgi:hypothetical protein
VVVVWLLPPVWPEGVELPEDPDVVEDWAYAPVPTSKAISPSAIFFMSETPEKRP